MPTRGRILIVEDTATQAEYYKTYFTKKGHAVRCVYTGRDIVDTLRKEDADIILAGHIPADSTAASILKNLESIAYTGAVVLLCGPEDNNAVPAFRGQLITLRQPAGIDQIYQTISTALKYDLDATMPEELAGVPLHSPRKAPQIPEFGGFIGTSGVMLSLYEQIQNAARSHATVFITGESGTGKEVCAQAIHKYSSCADNPFVPLNCAAIPRDLLESELFGHVRGAFTGAVADREGAASLAHNGTLFLDEIGEMDLHMQTKLLRFLQDGTFQRVGGSRMEHVDCRIICATNREPLEEIRAGRFREDLYYRLHVIPISMPPLRQRGDDVIDIAQTLLLRYADEEGKRFRGFDPQAEALLRRHDWPGNIRQLQNVIRNIVVMYDSVAVLPAMLPQTVLNAGRDPALSAPVTLGLIDGSVYSGILPLEQVEREAIERAIRACSGNIPRAAAMLQISPSTIYRKKAAWDAGSNPEIS